MIDENSRTTGFCLSQEDGLSFINLKSNPTTHRLRTIFADAQPDLGNGSALNDDSIQPMKVKTINGNIITLYASTDGKLLVKYA